MRTLVISIAMTVLIAVGAVSAMKSSTPAIQAAQSPQPAAISIQELQGQVDVKSLPALEIKDPI